MFDAPLLDPALLDSPLRQYPSIVHALWAAERENPDGLALVCGGVRLSYAELASRVRELRGILLGRGAAGERVAVLLPSSIEAVVSVLAAMSARAQALPANPFFSEPELHLVLTEARPRLVLAGSAARDKVAALSTELGLEAAVDAPAGLAVQLFAAKGSGGPSAAVPSAAVSSAAVSSAGGEAADPAPGDPALLIFTGGTTGEPKAVVHSHRSLAVSLLQHANAWPLETGKERFLSAAPVFHIWGLGYATLVPIYSQSAHFIISKYEPAEVLATLAAERITIFGGGPAPIYMGLTQIPSFKTTDFSSLKYCLTGGSPCPEELHRIWKEQTGCALLEGWGMSEAAPLCLNPPPGLTPPRGPRLLSVGRPVVGTEVQAVDLETGTRVLSTGEPGELRIRGPQVMRGYYGRPDATREALRDGWLHTGDIGYVDGDGYVFLVDRKKDMIIVGGYNVYPRSVDEVLFKHPKIAEAATVGKPDPKLGEVLVAFVVLEPGASLSEEEFFTFCQENLVKYRRPVEVTFLDSLPRTNAKKLDKKKLSAMARR